MATIRVVPRPWQLSEGIDHDGFLSAVATAEAIELRQQSRLLNSDDARRYHRASMNIERHARACGRTICRLGIAELEEMQTALGSTKRGVSRTFFPPWAVKESVRAYESAGMANRVTAAFAAAHNEDAGCVITIEFGEIAEYSEKPKKEPILIRQPTVADAIAVAKTTPACFSQDRRRSSQYDTFMAEVERALRSGQPVMVGAGAPHEVITEAFRMLSDPAIPVGRLRVMFVDGSEAASFKTGGDLGQGGSWGRSIRLGLMSMRHTELDIEVCGYAFRNRMVSLSRLQAEAEADCQRQATALFEELTAEGISDIELIHTGFEAAAIGFYRAVIAWNQTTEDKRIAVRPRYLTYKGYIDGTKWGI
jgi:hypothetical protein